MRPIVINRKLLLALCCVTQTALSSTTIPVSASLDNSCITYIRRIADFGTTTLPYTGIAQPIIAYQCTAPTTLTFAFDNGKNYVAPYRRMQHEAHPGNYLNYQVYQEWVDRKVILPPSMQFQADSSPYQAFIIYFQIVDQLQGMPGAYSDMISITLTY